MRIPKDTAAAVNANGDTLTIDKGDPSTYVVRRYDSTVYYKVDSVGHREYGRALRNPPQRTFARAAVQGHVHAGHHRVPADDVPPSAWISNSRRAFLII